MDKMIVYLVSILGEDKPETHFDIIEVNGNREWTYVVWFNGFTMTKPDGKVIGTAKAVMPHDSEESRLGFSIPENWTWG